MNLPLKSFLAASLILFLGAAPFALAKQIQKFNVNATIGDGKDGRVNAKWTQRVKETKIYEVKAKLTRKSGGDDTYVNLRCSGGETLDGGKRINLTTDKPVTVSWLCNNITPKGQPLVMNAYNGTVYIEKVWLLDDEKSGIPAR